MFTIVNGYKTIKSISPTVFSSILKEIKTCIQKTQEKQYNLLFKEELTNLADMYVLNYIQVPEGTSVWDECINRLNQRIINDTRNNLDTRYNFNITIEIMPYKNVWYFHVVCSNESISKGLLDSINKIEPCKVVAGEDVIDQTEDNAKIWEEIRNEYSGSSRIPMRQFYMPELPYSINEESIEFETVNERAKNLAESMEFAEIFNTICKGRQIQPFEIPKCYEEAAKELDGSEHHAENIRMKYTALTSVLPVLTIDTLKNLCGLKNNNNEQKPEDNKISDE